MTKVKNNNMDSKADKESTASEKVEPKGTEARIKNEDDVDEKDIEAVEVEEDTWNQKYFRLMADFQNFKKRSEKERGDIYAYATEEIVVQLLDVMDSFERALDHDSDEGFKAGIEMIYNQLKSVLEKSGVVEIDAVGAVFDPSYHNAMLTEDANSDKSGTILEVLQKGYTLKDKVIRFAMVKVAN